MSWASSCKGGWKQPAITKDRASGTPGEEGSRHWEVPLSLPVLSLLCPEEPISREIIHSNA